MASRSITSSKPTPRSTPATPAVPGDTQTSDGLTIGGDIIVGVNGKQIKKPDDVLSALSGKKPGDEVTIHYYRGRSKKSVRLKLANRPAGAAQSPQQQSPNPLIP